VEPERRHFRSVAVAVLVLGALLASGCATAPVAAPAPADGAAVAAQAPAAPAPRVGLFAHFQKTPEQRAQKWANFAKTPLGQMVNNLLKPLGGLTGGLLGPVGQDDPAKKKLPADSPAGAAAKIAAAEAKAKATIADLEFLSTKDCRRYPEAEAAILAALRAEPNECVRWAAAKALLSGCCCTPKVVKTLTVVVNQSDNDGNLAEESERVRLTAFLALEKCLQKCQPAKAEEPPENPGPKEPGKEKVAQVKFEEMTEADVFAAAWEALAKGVSVSLGAVGKLTGPANLRDMLLGPPLVGGGTGIPAGVRHLTGRNAGATGSEPPSPSGLAPASPNPLARDRSLTGLFKKAAEK
jgi:hypothetical protein